MAVVQNKKNISVFASSEDKELIKRGAQAQRRSVGSFILESALIRAREVLKNVVTD